MGYSRYNSCSSLLSVNLTTLLFALLSWAIGQIMTVHAQPQCPQDTLNELSVLSYNIQSRPFLDDCSEKAPIIGRKVRNFDLIGLQEAFSSFEELRQAAVPLQSVYFARRRHPFKLVNSGLGVLTRLPIETHVTEYFQEEGSLENRLGSKGVLMIRCRLNKGYLDFYTTHLAAGEGQKPIESKRAELKQILKFIDTHSPASHAVILCGDFNLRLNNLHCLESAGLQNAAIALGCQAKTFIDHIYYRSSPILALQPTRWQVLDKDFRNSHGHPLSDHAPLAVHFKILSPTH